MRVSTRRAIQRVEGFAVPAATLMVGLANSWQSRFDTVVVTVTFASLILALFLGFALLRRSRAEQAHFILVVMDAEPNEVPTDQVDFSFLFDLALMLMAPVGLLIAFVVRPLH